MEVILLDSGQVAIKHIVIYDYFCNVRTHATVFFKHCTFLVPFIIPFIHFLFYSMYNIFYISVSSGYLILNFDTISEIVLGLTCAEVMIYLELTGTHTKSMFAASLKYFIHNVWRICHSLWPKIKLTS